MNGLTTPNTLKQAQRLRLSEAVNIPPNVSPVMFTAIVNTLPSEIADLRDAATFKRLLDCLSYALAIDDSVNVPAALGLIESMSNQDALGMWVKNEINGIQFLDASALFNFLVQQLDNFVFTARSTQ